MKYMGSKNRLSKELIPIIQKYIDDNNIKNYLEPFVGGANVIDKIKCENRYGSDNCKYLIALLKQTQKDISIFPSTINKEIYNDVRQNYKESKYEDWFIGLVGFCASYNAKWFGGYANNVKTKEGITRNYTDEAIRNLVRQSKDLKDIKFECLDFRGIKPIKNFLIYCDIPYKNSTTYSSDDFPYEEFYE